MVTTIFGTIAAAFVVAAACLYFFPEFTKRWIGRIKAVRRALFGAFSLLAAFVFVASGQPLLMLTGAVIFFGVAVAALTSDMIGVDW